MKIKLLLVLMILPIWIFGQNYSWKKPKGTYGFILGFDLGMRHLSFEENYTALKEAQKYYLIDSESALLSFRLGFDYSWFIAEDMYLKTGLRLTNPGYFSQQLESLNNKDKLAINQDIGLEKNTTYNHRYFFLELPLAWRMIYQGRNCRSFIEAGISTQYYISTNLKAANNPVETIKLRENIFPFYFSGLIGIGAEYDLNDKIPVFIQLVCRYQLNRIDKGHVKEGLISLGIETGTRYYF